MSLTPAEVAELEGLVDQALELHSHSVARLVSIFQDRRATAPARRAHVLQLLEQRGHGKSSPVIGVTGTPGAGKSSLLGRLAGDLLDADPDLSVAVVAVDPSSAISGGALLGDRTRLRLHGLTERLYFRSEASDTELGGLSPSTFQVCRLLSRIFGCVIVETVGIGQSEADVKLLAEHVYLVIAPMGGDEVQFLKAGIVEVPDSFIINKSDAPEAEIAYRQLKASLWLARPFDAEEIPIHRTSAKSGVGLPELQQAFEGIIAAGGPSDADIAARDGHFFTRWVQDQWGRVGVGYLLAEGGGGRSYVEANGGFDAAQRAFSAHFVEQMKASDARN
ncbi:MAG: methylmalonyl Co-A mutase-associated GTPase MeaB [Marmoricola sp.]